MAVDPAGNGVCLVLKRYNVLYHNKYYNIEEVGFIHTQNCVALPLPAQPIAAVLLFVCWYSCFVHPLKVYTAES